MEPWAKFRQILIDHGELVTKIEFTQGNFDDQGRLIDEAVPTLTTEKAEIGWCHDLVYIVFIIDPASFTRNLFAKINTQSNWQIYGWRDFMVNFWPAKNFNQDIFYQQIDQEKYLQLQKTVHSRSSRIIWREYCLVIGILEGSGVRIINQLENNLTVEG